MQPVVFGKYTLLRRLAVGGMAELYLARSADGFGVERMLVLKVIAARFAKDPSFANMFKDEARIAATLNHPNVGQVFDVGEVMGRQFLAMEYLHGRDLRAIVRRLASLSQGGVPTAIALHIATRICAGLQHAHAARGLDGKNLGIIHRDVSPSNIMVTFDGHVKLLDFGIAKAKNRTALTEPGTIKGKVRYLSPQQLMGEPIDHRTDIFTLGISLWEATVGRHLFEGDQDIQVYEAIHSGRIQPPSELVADYSPALEAVVLKALAYHPDDRYGSAAEMQAALESLAKASHLPLTDNQTARFMCALFEEDLQRWTEAEKSGVSMLDFLISSAPGEDLEMQTLMQDEDGRHTRISEAVSRLDDEANRVTLEPLEMLPEAGDTIPDNAGGERRTVMFGEFHTPGPSRLVKPHGSTDGVMTLGSQSAVAPRRLQPRSGPNIKVGDGSAVEVSPDGSVQVHAGAQWADDEESGRRTMMHEVEGKSAAMGDPVIAASAAELERLRREAPEGQHTMSPEHERPKRPQTGDWSHQGSDDRRPGTHPFFKPLDVAQQGFENPYADGDVSLPRSRAPLAILLVVLAAAVVGGGIALVLMNRGDTEETGHTKADNTPKATATPPVKQSAKATVKSTPAGATVFRAVDGMELGKTPLAVAPREVAGKKLELHLSGHLEKKVIFPAGASTVDVVLTRDVGDGAAAAKDGGTGAAPKKTSSKRKRPPRRRLPSRPEKPSKELKNPF